MKVASIAGWVGRLTNAPRQIWFAEVLLLADWISARVWTNPLQSTKTHTEVTYDGDHMFVFQLNAKGLAAVT